MDQIPPPSIPVLGKSPQPVGYCYPLGSSAINEALAGLPNFDRLTLRFSNRSPLFATPPPQNALPLLRVIYTNYPVYQGAGEASIRQFQGGERWAIEILPVPYQHREPLKQWIIEHALPLLREWLSGPPPQGTRKLARICWYEPTKGAAEWEDVAAAFLR